MLSRYSTLIKDSKVSGLKNRLRPGGPHLKFHFPTESLRYNGQVTQAITASVLLPVNGNNNSYIV